MSATVILPLVLVVLLIVGLVVGVGVALSSRERRAAEERTRREARPDGAGAGRAGTTGSADGEDRPATAGP